MFPEFPSDFFLLEKFFDSLWNLLLNLVLYSSLFENLRQSLFLKTNSLHFGYKCYINI